MYIEAHSAKNYRMHRSQALFRSAKLVESRKATKHQRKEAKQSAALT